MTEPDRCAQSRRAMLDAWIATLSGRDKPDMGDVKAHLKECHACSLHLFQDASGDLIGWMGSKDPGELMKMLPRPERTASSSKMTEDLRAHFRQLLIRMDQLDLNAGEEGDPPAPVK